MITLEPLDSEKTMSASPTKFPAVIAIIPARLDSNRLPGKALREVNGRPLIEFVLARSRRILGVSATIVATTTRSVDDLLVNYLERNAVPYFRGEAEDVAKRLLDCAVVNDAEYFIRINGDSVFLDHYLIGEGVALCKDRKPDLVTNLPGRTFPYGIAIEIIRTATFARIYSQMSLPDEREHVTKYLYNNPDQIRMVTMSSLHPELAKARLVVDTPEDFKNFKALVNELGDDIDIAPYNRVAILFFQLLMKGMEQ